MMDWLSNWKERIFIVKPDTVIKWHRTEFKIYWKWKSKYKGGRPGQFAGMIVKIPMVNGLHHVYFRRAA